MITISIWLYILSLMGATGLGVFLMCLCNVASDTERAFTFDGRALDLAIALRRLLRAVQGYIETGDGFEELAGAMSNAAEVLDTPRAVREGDNSEDGSEPPYPYPIGSGILCLWKRVVFSVEFVSRCRPPIHEAGHQVQMWIGQAKFPVGELWCNAEDAWTWLDGLFNAEVTSRAARVL